MSKVGRTGVTAVWYVLDVCDIFEVQVGASRKGPYVIRLQILQLAFGIQLVGFRADLCSRALGCRHAEVFSSGFRVEWAI